MELDDQQEVPSGVQSSCLEAFACEVWYLDESSIGLNAETSATIGDSVIIRGKVRVFGTSLLLRGRRVCRVKVSIPQLQRTSKTTGSQQSTAGWIAVE